MSPPRGRKAGKARSRPRGGSRARGRVRRRVERIVLDAEGNHLTSRREIRERAASVIVVDRRTGLRRYFLVVRSPARGRRP